MPNLYIASDSTAAIKENHRRPETGWGEHLHTFVSPHLKIVNKAVNGRSSKSFIDEGRLDDIDTLLKSGDYLIIQFGHNDQKIEDPLRYTHPHTTYKANLLRFIQVAKKHDAIPILVSSITRRKFIHGSLDPNAIPEYPQAMREVAISHHVDFIDLYAITQKLLSDLGENASKKLFLHLEPGTHLNFPKGITDDTHLSDAGAKLMASLLAVELRHII